MKHNTMKVGNKVREIPDEFGWVMKEGVGIVLKVYNVGQETRVDLELRHIIKKNNFIEHLENV